MVSSKWWLVSGIRSSVFSFQFSVFSLVVGRPRNVLLNPYYYLLTPNILTSDFFLTTLRF